MWRGLAVSCLAGVIAGLLASSAWAVEKPMSEFPKDVKDVATAWTEPIKSVAEESRKFDPISAIWFGLLRGTVQSFERTVRVFLPEGSEPSELPQESDRLIEYTF